MSFFQLGQVLLSTTTSPLVWNLEWEKHQFEMNGDVWEAIKEIVLESEKKHETQNWEECEHIFQNLKTL